MPKYTPLIAELKARKLTKDYDDSGLNQTRLAEKEGCTSQNINQKLHKSYVKKSMAELLDKAGLTDSNLAKGLTEGRLAVRRDPFGLGILPDFNCRHKYIVTALEIKGHIKHNGIGNGNVIVSTIVFNFKSPEKIFAEKELNAANTPKE